jgi:hypothetical protein
MKQTVPLLLLILSIGTALAASDTEAIAVATRIVTLLSGKAPNVPGKVGLSTVADAPRSFRGMWKENFFDFRVVRFGEFEVYFPNDSTELSVYSDSGIGNTDPMRQPPVNAGYKSIEELILSVADRIERCGIKLPDTVSVNAPIPDGSGRVTPIKAHLSFTSTLGSYPLEGLQSYDVIVDADSMRILNIARHWHFSAAPLPGKILDADTAIRLSKLKKAVTGPCAYHTMLGMLQKNEITSKGMAYLSKQRIPLTYHIGNAEEIMFLDAGTGDVLARAPATAYNVYPRYKTAKVPTPPKPRMFSLAAVRARATPDWKPTAIVVVLVGIAVFVLKALRKKR